MARKSGSSNTAKTKVVKKVCSACGKEKSITRDFFVSYNSLHSDGRIPMCKDCIRINTLQTRTANREQASTHNISHIHLRKS